MPMSGVAFQLNQGTDVPGIMPPEIFGLWASASKETTCESPLQRSQTVGIFQGAPESCALMDGLLKSFQRRAPTPRKDQR